MKFENLTKDEMILDIGQMILVISAFTPKGSEGEKLLTEWKKKYIEEKQKRTFQR